MLDSHLVANVNKRVCICYKGDCCIFLFIFNISFEVANKAIMLVRCGRNGGLD